VHHGSRPRMFGHCRTHSRVEILPFELARLCSQRGRMVVVVLTVVLTVVVTVMMIIVVMQGHAS